MVEAGQPHVEARQPHRAMQVMSKLPHVAVRSVTETPRLPHVSVQVKYLVASR